MLSSHLFFCLPCLLPTFTVPCKVVLARPDELETCSYLVSLHLFTMISRSSGTSIACWILAQTSSLATWSLSEMRSILRWCLISMARILLCSSAAGFHDSQAYRKMDLTRERLNCSLELTEMLLSLQTRFNLLLSSVLSWRISQACNPRQILLSPGT